MKLPILSDAAGGPVVQKQKSLYMDRYTEHSHYTESPEMEQAFSRV